MTARRFLFWTHLTIGVTAGLVILAMSVTGVMLAFERQMIAWSDHRYAIHPPMDGSRMGLDAVLAKLQAAEGAAPSGIVIRSDPARPVEFNFGRERTVLVNPYSGDIVSEASGARSFFMQVENVHRWLALPLEKRELGEGITGACNLAFLGLVISGPFLWWPKKWTSANVAKVAWFRHGVNLRGTLWNWHHVFGIWCVTPLFFIVLTGVVMSYPWANDLLYRLAGNEPPPRISRTAAGQRPAEGGRGSGGRNHSERSGAPDGKPLDELLARAGREAPGWLSLSMRMPAAGTPVTVSADAGSGRPDLRTQITLDPVSGQVVRVERYDSYNLGRRLRIWGRFTHTGEAGGWLGQGIAAVATAAASILVVTGLWLSLRRLVEWRRRI